MLGELLDGAPVDVTTPFFQLGATSLVLVRAHGRLHELLDPGLAVVDMFAHPTVRRLAAHIASRRTAPAPPAVPSAPAPAPPDVPSVRAAARLR
ncbi:acyl carrier protein, partial [Actinomadura sp. CNU-125]|uniref:acyl carrier protein n=1 Tax=Actinomadura sp. CNU-125 TaxID=1904961 RepID=UPI0039672F67